MYPANISTLIDEAIQFAARKNYSFSGDYYDFRYNLDFEVMGITRDIEKPGGRIKTSVPSIPCSFSIPPKGKELYSNLKGKSLEDFIAQLILGTNDSVSVSGLIDEDGKMRYSERLFGYEETRFGLFSESTVWVDLSRESGNGALTRTLQDTQSPQRMRDSDDMSRLGTTRTIPGIEETIKRNIKWLRDYHKPVFTERMRRERYTQNLGLKNALWEFKNDHNSDINWYVLPYSLIINKNDVGSEAEPYAIDGLLVSVYNENGVRFIRVASRGIFDVLTGELISKSTFSMGIMLRSEDGFSSGLLYDTLYDHRTNIFDEVLEAREYKVTRDAAGWSIEGTSRELSVLKTKIAKIVLNL